jgi:hypothetical protein
MDKISFASPTNCTPFGVLVIICILFIIISALIYFYKYNTASTVSISIYNSSLCCVCSLIILNLCTIPIGPIIGWLLVILTILCMVFIVIMAILGYGGVKKENKKID